MLSPKIITSGIEVRQAAADKTIIVEKVAFNGNVAIIGENIDSLILVIALLQQESIFFKPRKGKIGKRNVFLCGITRITNYKSEHKTIHHPGIV